MTTSGRNLIHIDVLYVTTYNTSVRKANSYFGLQRKRAIDSQHNVNDNDLWAYLTTLVRVRFWNRACTWFKILTYRVKYFYNIVDRRNSLYIIQNWKIFISSSVGDDKVIYRLNKFAEEIYKDVTEY